MSRIRADRIVDRAATGAPLFPNGAVVTGVATATTFSGALSGNATSATSASGLTGTPDITVRNIVGVGATFSGVLSYEDVTNVDSVGIITAQSGVNVTAGGLDLKGVLQEKVVITNGKLSATPNINTTNGMVHYFTATEDATSTPNIYSSVGINTEMAVGDTIAVTIITTAGGSSYFSSRISIDGTLAGITTSWVGGSAPSAGGASGLDIYAYNIIKTGSAAYTVIGNLTNAA